MSNMTAILLAETAQVPQAQKLQTFLTDYLPDIFAYAINCFLIGLAVILVIILITFGLFKALSIFRNMADF